MSILRNPSRERWTLLGNILIDDNRVGGAALGLATYLFSKPDGWIIRTSHIASLKCSDGKPRFGKIQTVRNSIRQLALAGYIEYHEIRGEGGQLAGKEIILREEPSTATARELANRTSKKPSLGETEPRKNRASVKPNDREMQPLVSTKTTLNTETKVSTQSSSRFEDFWAAYPRKDNRKAAETLWNRASNRSRLDGLIDTLLADVKNRLKNDLKWQDTGGVQSRYIPHATTYLNGEQWDNSIQAISAADRLDKIPTDPRKLVALANSLGVDTQGKGTNELVQAVERAMR